MFPEEGCSLDSENVRAGEHEAKLFVRNNLLHNFARCAMAPVARSMYIVLYYYYVLFPFGNVFLSFSLLPLFLRK